jgi:DNA-binding NarL/FixJ family response regulator
MKQVLLADNQFLTREGLKHTLSYLTDYQLIGEVFNRKELRSFLSARQPEIVILDHSDADSFGFESIDVIRDKAPQSSILIVSEKEDKSHAIKTIEKGISNYILKKCGKEEFAFALKAAASKEKFICSSVLDKLLGVRTLTAGKGGQKLLSSRETEIIRYIAAGTTSSAIAETLNLSIHTIGTHRKNIMKKLGFKKASELVLFAIKEGIIG